MTKNHKQKKVTSIILKFKTPQCINFYRRAVCPDHWSLIFSCYLPSLALKVDSQKMYFQVSEPNLGFELEFNIIIENKISSNDKQRASVPRYKDTSYAVRVSYDQISEIKINGEDYWNSEAQALVKVFRGEKYHFKH